VGDRGGQKVRQCRDQGRCKISIRVINISKTIKQVHYLRALLGANK